MLSEAMLDELLRGQRTVKIWDAQHVSVFVEGTVIAYSMTPMVCVKDAEGVHHWHVVSLPIEVAEVHWSPVS